MSISKKWLAVIPVAALALAACGDGTGSEGRETGDDGATTTASADEAEVVLAGISFEPSEITVDPGTTITFVHEDGGIPHTVTADDGSFDSGQIADGDSFTVTVEQAGEIPFFCEIHPGQMQGTIRVTEG